MQTATVIISVNIIRLIMGVKRNHTRGSKTIETKILAKYTLKPGFHYPSWRPELTARVDGWPVSITRQYGPCWRVMETGHPSTRAINSGRQLG